MQTCKYIYTKIVEDLGLYTLQMFKPQPDGSLAANVVLFYDFQVVEQQHLIFWKWEVVQNNGCISYHS